MADHNDRPQLPDRNQEPQPTDQTDQDPDSTVVPHPIEEQEARRAALRAWWDDAWSSPDGVLYRRWEDLRQAPELGWHQMANWVKALLAVATLSLVLLLLDSAATVLADEVHRLLTAAPTVQIGTDASTGVWAVVDQPIRSYIAQHSTGLTVSGSTIYTLWQVAGLTGLIGGFLRSTAARLLWVAWGAGSAAMIWSAAPADGRTLATGIAVLAWSIASVFALRGLSLRPVIVTHIHNPAPAFRPEAKAEIHLPAQSPQGNDSPDNVRQFQQR
ncbi:hypothetical protein [Streptomyces melanogenes]|uniref:hypothetical protein n=1 Tax=Streptomyces melanogenes TaxID=67326 RepID=UPI00167E48C1|nr:hypothetical protein [Streptomyces melanogenes]GGP90149.1 hypothetical protein GCM10010278_80750 [Streptomyces melanogenes]